jgi:hypothetical protein
MESANGIVNFLKLHPHCTKPLCTTCGGIWGFLADLRLWINVDSPNLLGSFQSLTPTDLMEITEWQVFLEHILSQIPELLRESAVYPSWRDHFGISMEYDLFAIQHAPAASFDYERDDAWIRTNLFKFDLERHSESLQQFMGDWINKYPELVDLLEVAEKRKHLRIQIEEREKQELEQRNKAAKDLREMEHARLEQQKVDIIEHFSSQDPKERVIQVLEDPTIMLSQVPGDWALVPDWKFSGLNSLELTELIKYLNKKLSKRDKSNWKKLRDRLYQLRQTVYNRERKFPGQSSKE